MIDHFYKTICQNKTVKEVQVLETDLEINFHNINVVINIQFTKFSGNFI